MGAPRRAPPGQAGAAATRADRGGRAPPGLRGACCGKGGRVKRIVEGPRERPPTIQKKITEIQPPSVYCFRRAADVVGAGPRFKPDNDQGELYLTDVIGVLARGRRQGGGG